MHGSMIVKKIYILVRYVSLQLGSVTTSLIVGLKQYFIYMYIYIYICVCVCVCVCVTIQYKPMKCTIPKLIFLFL